MINDLGWRDLADRRKDTHRNLFFNVVNHEVNVPSEGIRILVTGGTMKKQTHNKFMHI